MTEHEKSDSAAPEAAEATEPGAGSPGPPSEAQRHLARARAYLENKDYEHALRECDLAIELAPDCAVAHSLRGLILHESGEREQALEAYRTAVSLDPDFSEAQGNLSQAQAELRAQRNRQWREEVRASPSPGDRSGCITAAAVVIGLFAGCPTIGRGAEWLGRLNQPVWYDEFLGTVWVLPSSKANQVIVGLALLDLALGVALLAAVVGMWRMRKWGAVLLWVLAAVQVGSVIWGLLQGEAAAIGGLALASVLLVTGIALTRLWRRGELV